MDQDDFGYDLIEVMRGGFRASQLMKVINPIFQLIPAAVLVWLNPGMRIFFDLKDVRLKSHHLKNSILMHKQEVYRNLLANQSRSREQRKQTED